MQGSIAEHRMRGLLLAAAVLLAAIGGLLAQEPEPTEVAEDSTRLDQTIEPTTVEQRQDSLYALINENFQLVQPIFKRSCYDCHSDQTVYPWYHKLPLIKSLLDSDVKEGRQNLDFTAGFPFAGKRTPLERLWKIREEIAEGDMPPWDYRLIHWGTAIKGDRRDSVYEWIDSSAVMLETFYQAEHLPFPRPGKATDSDED